MVTFQIDIVANPRGFNSGSREVDRRLVDLERRANALRATLLRTFGVLAGAAAIRGGVRTLAQFEQSLATVRAVTGATAEEFAQLRDRAQELGATTRFTATEAGDALLALSRAGFSVSESLQSVQGTLLLAQAGGLGLAEATDIAASTLRGFRLDTAETNRVVDVLTLTANSANTTVGQLGEGLKLVAPIAAGVGVSLESTNAALAVLSDAGLKASLAGTGLRRVLGELESPSSATQRILAELGVTADEVQVSQVGLVEALQRLAEAGVDTGTALEIFGQRGGPAFEVLSNNLNGPRGLPALIENLQGADGTAQQTAATIDDNLNGALLRANSALEAFILSLGDSGATSALTAIFDGLASSLRVLANNGEITAGILSGVAGIITLRLIPSVIALGRATLLANPAIVAAGAAFVALSAAAGALERDLRLVAEAFNNLETDAQFGDIGTGIRLARQEVNGLVRQLELAGDITAQQGQELNTILTRVFNGAAEESAAARQELEAFFEATGAGSESQRAAFDRLITRARGLREESVRVAEAGQQVAEAQERQKTTVENSLASLDRQIQLLQQRRRESELQVALENEIQSLLVAGQRVSPEDREAIESKLREIEALQLQADVLEEIKGPQEEQARRQAALNALLEQGAISGEEYRAALGGISEAVEDAAGRDPFTDQLDSLRQSIDLLRTRSRFGEEAATATQLENDLRRQGIELTNEQRAQLRELVVQQAQLAQQVRDETDARQQAERLANRRANIAARLDINAQLIAQEQELNAILAERPDLAQEIAVALENVQLRTLEASTALEDGFSRAFIKLGREAEDFASAAEGVVNSFADNATDALTEFIETGQFSFKEFARSILADVTRIIARLLVLQAIQAAVGALGGGAGAAASAGGSAIAGARADGGPVQAGRSYLVGEDGPEILQTTRPGTIIPNGQPATSSPEVNVQVVNVQDPNEIPQVIASGDADEAILNALARNPDRVKQVVS